ncbi:MAG: DUF5348 domain-containing protein [Oscillospiraceae bacterium]|nr:DUF5348 domain-containing protein [Oscillospiraceae bacterium]
MKITETTEALISLNAQIKTLLRKSGFTEYNGFYPDEYKTNRKSVTDGDGYTDEVVDLSPDEWQLVHEYEQILDELDIISDSIGYLNKPVTHEGKLCFTSRERYAVDGKELSCGACVEYQRYDEEHGCSYWFTDRVEYSDTYGGYYFFSSKKALEKGLTVRIRW